MNPSRAVQFATEAVAAADGLGDAVLLAEALDAELLVHWGPDDLAERLRIRPGSGPAGPLATRQAVLLIDRVAAERGSSGPRAVVSAVSAKVIG
jgi:hypothetical protein